MSSGPSPQDLVFARAVVSRGVLPKDAVQSYLGEHQQLLTQGHNVGNLAQFLVWKQLITADQARQLIEDIKAYYQRRQTRPSQASPTIPPHTTPHQPHQHQPAAVAPGTPNAPYDSYSQAPQATGMVSAGPVGGQNPEDLAGTIKLSGNASGGMPAMDAQPWSQAAPVAVSTPEPQTQEGGPALFDVGAQVHPQSPPPATPGNGFGHPQAGATAPLDPIQPQPPRQGTTAPLVEEDRRSGLQKALDVQPETEQFEFGPYRVISEIARGGMGIIYEAQEIGTGNTVALKALINVDAATDKQLRRFIQEAQSAQKLDHEGIVKIHDIGVFNDVPYFSMDLLRGEPFSKQLQARLRPREAMLETLTGICRAVHYAHTQGVIHRDLKPANIVVDQAGTPVLTDFGLAKNLDSKFNLTADGALVGTPLYLSPEQVAGQAKDVDARCDVYGLGVMMYQILTGKLPFFGRNPYEVYQKVLKEEPKAPRAIDPTISDDLERICLKALMKNREARYASAQELADDIARALRGEAPTVDQANIEESKKLSRQAMPDPGRSRTDDQIKLDKPLPDAIGTPSGGSAGFGGNSPGPVAPQRRRASARHPRPRRRKKKGQLLLVLAALGGALLLFLAAIIFLLYVVVYG